MSARLITPLRCAAAVIIVVCGFAGCADSTELLAPEDFLSDEALTVVASAVSPIDGINYSVVDLGFMVPGTKGKGIRRVGITGNGTVFGTIDDLTTSTSFLWKDGETTIIATGPASKAAPVVQTANNAGEAIIDETARPLQFWNGNALVEITGATSMKGSSITELLNERGQVPIVIAGEVVIWEDGSTTSTGVSAGRIQGFNDSGDFVFSTNSKLDPSFFHSAGTTYPILDGAGNPASGTALSNSGQVLGSQNSPRAFFLWRPDGTSPLPGFTLASDLTDSGWVLGAGGKTGPPLVRAPDGTVVTLPADAIARGINDHGVVAGTRPGTDGFDKPHLWQGALQSDLPLDGGVEAFVYDLNDAGQVVGKIDDRLVLWVPATPVDEINDVAGQIQDLITSGALPRGQGQALVRRLGRAAQLLEQDRVFLARISLRIAVVQLRVLMRRGALDPATGDPLVSQLEGLIGSLG